MPQDDDVITGTLRCAFCSKDLEFLSISEREAHYESHFLNDIETQAAPEGTKAKPMAIDHLASSSSTNVKKTYVNGPGWQNKNSQKKPWKLLKETDVFWYPEQISLPPSSFTPGLISLLRKGLSKGHSRGNIRRAILCNEKAVHVNRELWDAGWGCGYRNFLMSCASLMSQTQQPMYFPLLDSPLSPSIRHLQHTIEAAWNAGFDLEGQRQLKKLVDTSKWIGTGDLWVAFTFCGIPAELVDFDLENVSRGPESVIEWVVNYFTPKEPTPKPSNIFDSLQVSPIIITDKMPLILQHNGHSRTIVGYEIDKTGATSLLTFDPAFRPTDEIRKAALAEFAQFRARSEDAISNGTDFSIASSSNLKRKRSMEASHKGGKSPRVEESTGAKPKASVSKALSPLKNGVARSASSHEGKELDLYGVTRKFRLDLKKLSKKKNYQILYFPMTDPLTDYQKSQRKEVRSTKTR